MEKKALLSIILDLVSNFYFVLFVVLICLFVVLTYFVVSFVSNLCVLLFCFKCHINAIKLF